MSNVIPVSTAHAELARHKVGAAQTVVVKVGSNVLVGNGSSVIDRPTFCGLVESLANVANVAGRRIILVTSGAVAVGRRALFGRSVPDERDTLAKLQALAAVGQPSLMHLYTREFEFYGMQVAQVLLTPYDLSERARFLNARRTLRALGRLDRVIPIVNENDTVAHDELRFGDNDNLAALVTNAVGADLLVILSDVDAVYDANPVDHPSARPISIAYGDDPALAELAGGPSAEGYGSGGMSSKVRAGRVACSSGVPTVIAPGRSAGILGRILSGEPVGTLLVPSGDRLSARKAWIGFSTSPTGELHVDAGAAAALRSRGTSLLPTGVTQVDGDFGVGEVVEVVDPNGTVVGRGLVAYAATDLIKIAGLPSRSIQSTLGFHNGDAVVHVDDFALVED